LPSSLSAGASSPCAGLNNHGKRGMMESGTMLRGFQ
jgi:hypothetical protein